MWMDLESIIQNEVSQKEKNKYHLLMHICGIQKNDIDDLINKADRESDMYVDNECVGTKGKEWVGDLDWYP